MFEKFEPSRSFSNAHCRRCFKEETFGPLVPIFKFETDQEAVQLANTTEYGLASYFFTQV